MPFVLNDSMLDFNELKTPAKDGDVLVAPKAKSWIAAAQKNQQSLSASSKRVAGAPLSEWRRSVRESIVGTDDALVIVVGHQPEFIHPGVWAKHVVATRMADACVGVACNLIVDTDVPKQTSLNVPALSKGGLVLEQFGLANAKRDQPFEWMEPLGGEQVSQLSRRVRESMGSRYQASQMATFFANLAQTEPVGDWVNQYASARMAVEAEFGIELQERRISRTWCTPLVVDMLQNARVFSNSYNAALAEYRRVHRIRGSQRPMPDLLIAEDRVELPLWAYQGHALRRRLLVADPNDTIQLYGGDEMIGEWSRSSLRTCHDLESAWGHAEGWLLRPRALAITIWARLLLADMFVHGIGGAKYDRISDLIIADYYGETPPAMACVSATLHLGLPDEKTVGRSAVRLRRDLRDLQWNPQRHLGRRDDVDALMAERERSVQVAKQLRRTEPHNRAGRREAFLAIRQASAAMLESHPERLEQLRRALDASVSKRRERDIALGREYFFALYPTDRLQQLLGALPQIADFRV